VIPDWPLILELLKVAFSVQMIAGILIVLFVFRYNDEFKSLLNRISKLPGGVELTTQQADKVKTEKQINDKVSSEPQSLAPAISTTDETFKKLFEAERARAYFWEYSYLNYFLVQTTQRALDYFNSLTAPITVGLYDSLFTPTIPESVERQAIISALQRHHLINIENDLITVTPKGREYIQWRGVVLNALKNT
jgi:hypothetical protein